MSVEYIGTWEPYRGPLSWGARMPFGIMLHENKRDTKPNRVQLLQEWVLRFWPDAMIIGHWSEAGQEALGRRIEPVEHSIMGSMLRNWRCTLTLPTSGSGWPTAKPWECFTHATVCFFHPDYDSQNHVLASAPGLLRTWLRVESPEDLAARVKILNEDEDTWRAIIDMQREHVVERMRETRNGMVDIEKALGLA